MRGLRHRHILLLPFALLVLVVIAGGVLNTTDARGQVIDDMTDIGVPDALITHGSRSTTTDQSGEFVLTGVPRTSLIHINARGYQVESVPSTADEIRLEAVSLTLYAWDDTEELREKGVPHPQVRLGDRILSTGNDSGQAVIAPHPGHRAKLFVCATGYESKEVEAEGVLMEITMTPSGEGVCPPLPTASPSPGALPSPEAPSPEVTPSPTASP